MSDEKKQVLEMLAEGKITADEAERLLEKLVPFSSGHRDRHARRDHGNGRRKRFHLHKEVRLGDDTDEAAPTPPQGALKYLRVLVNSDDGDTVNIRVPLALVRTGIALTTVIPEKANEKLEAKGIDLSSLSELRGEELLEALRDLKVDVDAADGTTVRIFCE